MIQAGNATHRKSTNKLEKISSSPGESLLVGLFVGHAIARKLRLFGRDDLRILNLDVPLNLALASLRISQDIKAIDLELLSIVLRVPIGTLQIVWMIRTSCT